MIRNKSSNTRSKTSLTPGNQENYIAYMTINPNFSVTRFLDYEDIELLEARAYAKRPRQGRATYPLVNQNPSTSTMKDNFPPREEPPHKRNRAHQEDDDTISLHSASNRDHSASVQGNTKHNKFSLFFLAFKRVAGERGGG